MGGQGPLVRFESFQGTLNSVRVQTLILLRKSHILSLEPGFQGHRMKGFLGTLKWMRGGLGVVKMRGWDGDIEYVSHK